MCRANCIAHYTANLGYSLPLLVPSLKVHALLLYDNITALARKPKIGYGKVASLSECLDTRFLSYCPRFKYMHTLIAKFSIYRSANVLYKKALVITKSFGY